MNGLSAYPEIVVLGAGGLLGRALSSHLKNHHPRVVELTRSGWDLTRSETFGAHRFERDGLVLDAAAQISGNEQQVQDTNVLGLDRWLQYLRAVGFKGRYAYVSTLSTLDAAWIARSPYVASKAAGEALVRNALPDTRILRVSYLFGESGNAERLLPRLCAKMLRHERIRVDPVRIYVTPVTRLVAPLIVHSLGDLDAVNLVPPHSVRMQDLVEALGEGLGVSMEVELTTNRDADQSTLPGLTPFVTDMNVLEEVRAYGRAFAESL